MKLRPTIPVLLVCSSLVVSGCSLLNPHVTWPRPQKGEPVTLQSAIEYANDAKDAYKKAVGDQALLTNALGTALIPLGAATLGAGIAGVSAEPLAYLALSGAAIYGVGTWLSSAPRQSVYIAGINGITCAVEAILPLDFNATDLESGLGDLNTQAGLAEYHAREVTRLISEVKSSVGKDTDQTKSAAESVNSARSVMETAQRTYGDGVSLSHLRERAGQLLVAKVDDIDALVAVQLKNTQPDLQSLPNLIQGLGQTARTLTPLPAGAAQLLGAVPQPGEVRPQAAVEELRKEQDRLVELEKMLSAEVAAMNKAVGKLSAASTKVAAIANSATRSKPSDTLKKCGVKEVETEFTLQPSGDVALAQGQTIPIIARGGKTPYRAYLTPQPAVGVSLLQPIGGGSTVMVSAATDAKPNEYQLFVEDATLNVQSKKLTIVGAAKTDAEDEEADDAETAVLKDFVEKVKPGRSFSLQGGTFELDTVKLEGGVIKVTLKSDGKHTSDVDLMAIKKGIVGLNRTNPLPTANIKVVNFGAIETAGSVIGTVTPQAAILKRVCTGGPIVDAMKAKDIKKLQRALCLKKTSGRDNQVDGLWGCDTRDAIKAYQRTIPAADNGLLTAALRDTVLNLQPDEISTRCGQRAPSSATNGAGVANGAAVAVAAIAPPVDAAVLSSFARRLPDSSLQIGSATLAINSAVSLATDNLISIVVSVVPPGANISDEAIKTELLKRRLPNEEGITADSLRIARQ